MQKEFKCLTENLILKMSEEKKRKSDSVGEQIQSSFLESRKVFLWGEVSDRSARDLTEKLLYLENSNPGKI